MQGWDVDDRLCPKTRKVIASYTQAKAILKKTLRWKPDKEKQDLTLYHCPICRGWHIGHNQGHERAKRYYLELKKRKERYGF